MKRAIQIFSLALILSLTSCMEEQMIPETSSSLFKSVSITKIDDGTFNVVHETTSDDVATEYHMTQDVNAIELFKSSALGKRINSKNLRAIHHELKLHFISDEEKNLPEIVLIDSDLPEDMELLKDYSFSYEEAGIISLNFEVKRGVIVEFVNDNGKNEIHLSMGNGTKTRYTKQYRKDMGDEMSFNFVQNITRDGERKKPIVIVVGGDL